MPQQVEIMGQGVVEFPDEMSADDIKTALRNKPPQFPSSATTLPNQVVTPEQPKIGMGEMLFGSGYVGRGEFAPEAGAQSAPIGPESQDALAKVAKGVFGERGIGGMIPKSLGQLGQMLSLPRSGNVDEQMQQSEELGKAWRGEYGLEAQAGAITGSVLQAAPLLHLPFAESPLRPTPKDLELVQRLRSSETPITDTVTQQPKPQEVIQNAVQEPSTGEVLQRQSQEVGATGGGRTGVEQGVQGQETPQASTQEVANVPPEQPAPIVAAATRNHEGKIFTGTNHAQTTDAVYNSGGRVLTSKDQGFVDANGNFLNRQEATRRVNEINQFKLEPGEQAFSEDQPLEGNLLKQFNEMIGVPTKPVSEGGAETQALIPKEEVAAVPQPEQPIVYHGSKSEFETFRPTSGDIGFHFGTKEQADWRVGDEGTVKPYTLDIKNPLRLEDQGGWYGEDVVKMVNDKIGSQLSPSASTLAIRRAIKDAGYDGIVYKNKFEHDLERPSEDSYIAFDPSQIKPIAPVPETEAATTAAPSVSDQIQSGKGYIHVNLRGNDLDLSKPLSGWVLPAESGDFPNAMNTKYGRAGKQVVFVPGEWVTSKGGRPPKIKEGFIPQEHQIGTIKPEDIRPSGTVDWKSVFKEKTTSVSEPTETTTAQPLPKTGESPLVSEVNEGLAAGEQPPELQPAISTGQPPSETSPQALGITPPMPGFIKSIANYFVNNTPSQIWNSIKGSLDATLGKTFAKTTIADRQAGELGAKWISSRIAAPHLADTFATQVLEGTGIDPVKFGAALTEDNLRSVKAASPDPQSVTSIIGAKNSPFQTEAEYQSFLNDPATQQAIQRHQQLWEQTVDPMFRKAQSLDPNEPLPTRGEQTSARINLFNDVQGKGKNVVSGTGGGNLTATFKRKSPFARRATGTGQNYNVNYNDMMANTFGRQLEIANKNAFEDRLIETGNAVVDKPGANPILPDGESTVGYPLTRKSTAAFLNASGEPQTIPITQNIYIRKSLSGEYRRGANVDLIHVPGLIRGFNNVMNKTALAGLTDASVHVMNLGTALMTRPSVVGSVLKDSLLSALGRADAVAIIPKIISKAITDNKAQVAELSEIGAMKSEFATKNPAGKFIQWMDKTTRLILDDAYKSMVKEGLVEDTDTNRREFVNQVGQYNKRAQGDLRRLARDSGFGPFATAGTTFNTLGLRTMTLSPGVKASSPMAAAALRANILSKWIGASAFVGAMNYLLTKDKGGGVTGRPGVPLGRLDSGMNDKNGNPLSVPVFDLLGLGRGLRVTGARGFIESQRKGLTLQNSFDSAARDIFNSNTSPFLGPPIRFGMVAVTGQQPAINVGRVSKVVPPGESQSQENLKQAIIDANPVLKSVALAREPGQGVGAAVRQQIPRLSLLPSQNAEFMSKYPEIVRKAQAREYVNDVIRRARRMNPEDKQQFLDESLKKLVPEDQKNALRQFKYSRVMGKSNSSSASTYGYTGQ